MQGKQIHVGSKLSGINNHLMASIVVVLIAYI